MLLEKTIDTPMGVVTFKGEITEEEMDYIVKTGLLALMATGKIKTEFTESVDVMDAPDQLQ